MQHNDNPIGGALVLRSYYFFRFYYRYCHCNILQQLLLLLLSSPNITPMVTIVLVCWGTSLRRYTLRPETPRLRKAALAGHSSDIPGMGRRMLTRTKSGIRKKRKVVQEPQALCPEGSLGNQRPLKHPKNKFPQCSASLNELGPSVPTVAHSCG